jgi:hypothetical protein
MYQSAYLSICLNIYLFINASLTPLPLFFVLSSCIAPLSAQYHSISSSLHLYLVISICPSLFLFAISQYLCISVSPPPDRSIILSIYTSSLSIYLPIPPEIYLSTSLYLSISLSISASPYLGLPVYLYLYLSVFLSTSLSLSPSLALCLFPLISL